MNGFAKNHQTSQEGTTMNYSGKSLTLLQLIPHREFRELCDRFQIDKGVRKLTAQKHVWALVMSFILKLESLREIEATLGIPRSSLSDANANRESAFFEELCQLVLLKIYANLQGRKIKQAVRTLLAIDSTECRLHGSLSKLPQWRSRDSGSQNKASVKLHVIWNINGEWVEEFRITPSRSHDGPVARVLKVKANYTYVFDRAYNNLTFWWKILKKGADFITRLSNVPRYQVKTFSLKSYYKQQTGVLWEGKWVPTLSAFYRHIQVPKNFSLKHVIYRDPESKKIFHFVTSNLKLCGQTIADSYKKRWAVELLFRWLKGHLRMRTLEPRNTNAVQIQLAISVLVQLLIALHRILTRDAGSLWECLRNLRTSWYKAALHSLILKTGKLDPISPIPAPIATLRRAYS